MLSASPVAVADPFSQVYDYYRAHGSVAPCAFPEQTLQKALNEVPPDINQYAPDFPAAITSALQERAQGACAAGGSAVAPTHPTAPAAATKGHGGGGGSSTPAPPASANGAGLPVGTTTSSGSSGPSAAVVAIAVIAGLLAILAALWAYGRWRGVESPWLLSLGHSFSEAGYRIEATWSEFTDWLRTGR
jgi:hypothetical protein